MKDAFGDNAGIILTGVLLVIYVVLIKFAAQYPDLELDDPNAEVVELPEMGPTAKTGFHYLLPIVVLVWFLMIERKSPGLSAFWATALLIFQVLTQKPLKAYFRGEANLMGAFNDGLADLLAGLTDGAKNMIGIGVATATAAMLVFAAGTQKYFFARSKMYVSVLFILIAFTLFRPGFWLDMVWAPYDQKLTAEITTIAGQLPAGADIRLKVSGENLATGQLEEKFVRLSLGDANEDGAARLEINVGLTFRDEEGKLLIDTVGFDSPAAKAKLDFDWQIVLVELPSDRLPKKVFWLPALGMLGLIIVMQRRRRKSGEAAA
jgi:hypothetical protein